MQMRETQSDSPGLECVLARLALDPTQLDAMQLECQSMAGAKARAEWLLNHEATLRREFDSAESLAGLLLHRAKQGMGTYANVPAFASK